MQAGIHKGWQQNRLREQISIKLPMFSQANRAAQVQPFVSIAEISNPKNDYNLNIPRYIDNQEVEDIQDIEAHTTRRYSKH
jgi:type I restriction enzyme M protein